MKWQSIGEFIAMGGYGFYIWSTFALAAALIALEIVLVFRRHRAAIRSLQEPDPECGGENQEPRR